MLPAHHKISITLSGEPVFSVAAAHLPVPPRSDYCPSYSEPAAHGRDGDALLPGRALISTPGRSPHRINHTNSARQSRRGTCWASAASTSVSHLAARPLARIAPALLPGR